MVERPIKKSERQPQADADKDSGNQDFGESNHKSSKSSGNRSTGKGKKSSYGDENKQPISPALARGPKPVKPKVVTTPEPETESESTSEDSAIIDHTQES
jgi:hypothetical protein